MKLEVLGKTSVTNKKNPQNLYYVCARGEHTSFPKPLLSARTFNVIGSLDHNTDQTLLVHQKLKEVCQRQFTEV